MSLKPLPKSSTSDFLSYKNFKAELRFGQDNEFIVVKLIGIPRLFQARNRETAEEEFRRVVDHELVGKLGPVEEGLLSKEHSGNIALRMGPLLHQDLVLAAHRSGKSLNTYIEEKLLTALEAEAMPDTQGEAPLPDKVSPPAVYRLVEDEEAAAQLFQDIQDCLQDKINIFQFPTALKQFLSGLGILVQEIQPFIKPDKLDDFVARVLLLLHKYSN